MTYTVTTLQVSKAAYEEIKSLLGRAGYQHLVDSDGVIDMTHIGVVRVAEDPDESDTTKISTCPNCELGFVDMALHDANIATSLMKERKDNAYWERNCLVAMLARIALRMGAKAGIRRSNIPDWDPEWHGCVYIELPTGQASWHYHDSHAYMFEDLPPYEPEWDGHDTPEKYRRVKAAFRPVHSNEMQAGRLKMLLDAFAAVAGEVAFYVKLQPSGVNYRNTPEYLRLRREYDEAWQNVFQFAIGG